VRVYALGLTFHAIVNDFYECFDTPIECGVKHKSM
jgi:hypothetical protein